MGFATLWCLFTLYCLFYLYQSLKINPGPHTCRGSVLPLTHIPGPKSKHLRQLCTTAVLCVSAFSFSLTFLLGPAQITVVCHSDPTRGDPEGLLIMASLRMCQRVTCLPQKTLTFSRHRWAQGFRLLGTVRPTCSASFSGG